MSKFKKKIVSEIRKDQKEEKNQKILKQKYKVGDDVLVIEKSNMFKFTVKLVANLVRIFCTITILMLAACGLLALIYPQPRADLLEVMLDTYRELQGFIGG